MTPVPTLEQEVKELLLANRVKHTENTFSTTEVDFVVETVYGSLFHLDVKEKRFSYNVAQWPRVSIPERDLFIVDDLSIRRLLRHAPNCGIIARDTPTGRYVFFSMVHLLEMPKTRVNRPMAPEYGGGYKGKWMIDFRYGVVRNSLIRAFVQINQYVGEQESILSSSPVWGAFHGEQVEQGGKPRTKADHDREWRATRPDGQVPG